MAFQTRLFLRIISKSREVYLLKIVTLAISFACTILIILFASNEFGYDRFHQDYHSIFRILQKNNDDSYSGNRLSNKIPYCLAAWLNSAATDSMYTSRVKLLTEINVRAANNIFELSRIHASDPDVCNIFTFEIMNGSLREFKEKEHTAIISASSADKYFGTNQAAGKELAMYTFGDTIRITVAAVYKDFPGNSHEEFNVFIRFDSLEIQSLHFNPEDTGMYGRLIHGNKDDVENNINARFRSGATTYLLQPIDEIYFGPMVTGDDARHGDHYSIILLICITFLIFFLALASFINLTTLTLPNRTKELAIRKLAGTGQAHLVANFAKESILIVGLSLTLAITLLVLTSNWVSPTLSINLVSSLLQADIKLILLLTGLCIVATMAPLIMTFRFTGATPTRLLSSEAITFPKIKRTIIFLQLGISLFLIVASMVIRRQISYSLLKEPGRNYNQVVYVSYPKDLSNDGLIDLRAAWKQNNPNVIDIIASSQLPHRIVSKELNSGFHLMSVDREFKDFFDLQMTEGNWFKANDGDSIVVVNEHGKRLLKSNNTNVVGVFRGINGQFNQPEKPVKLNVAPYFSYNYLFIRILEVDIRKTIGFLERQFETGGRKATVSFLNTRFEEWLAYQDKLNKLSGVLSVISAVLSCCAIYGLSISIVRDKLKQIAIHKLCGANVFNITRLLVREFTTQLVLAILFFGPLTYIALKEMLRTFVYSTNLSWVDPLLPLAYCGLVIILLCGIQARGLNRRDLSTALKS